QRDMALINSITLGSKELPFFVSARAFGSLNILSTSNSDFEVNISGDGLPSTSMDEEITNGEIIRNVRSLRSFDLHINNPGSGHYYNATVGGAYVNVTISSFGTTNLFQLNLTVANESSSPVYDRAIAYIPDGATYTVNLLSDDYKFSTRILPYLSTPFDMSFNSNVSAGTFVVRGSQYDPDDSIGTVIQEMGTIEYTSENAYFVDQSYVYEGGAVILNQSQGQVVISAPSFSVQNVSADDGFMHVYRLDLVDVIGLEGKTSVSGYGTYSIKTNYDSMEENEYIARNLNINITTDHTAAWQRYMNNTLIRSGIPSTSFNVTSEDNVVTIALYGTSAGSSYDVTLTTSQTDIIAQVGPGWVS
ncbi:MAG: hypothetical protein R6U10_05315, partial [Thermoplasmatota archaeon]